MGKKTRKTRWRTLSIGDNQSDSESLAGDIQKHAPKKWGGNKYNSNNSTPVRNRDSFNKWGTSRSNSSTSENKITFNEDEYTRITTPRQDVLFKKGYLSKPKPQRKSLTSAGNSTGDGTPDHQSADGADYEQEPEVEYFPPEIYPTPLYYLNYETAHPQTTQPLVLYDPYGNTTFFYPPNYTHPQIGGSEPPTTSSTHSGEETTSNDLSVDLDKKRNSLDSDDFDLTDEQPSNGEETENPTLTSTPKYRVDAEEFVPRSYQPLNQPLLPLEVFPVVVFHPPMPPFFPPVNPQLENQNPPPPNTVDIQSIVSKLEKAAEKQKIEEKTEEKEQEETQAPPAVVESAPAPKPDKTIAKVVKEPPQKTQQQKTEIKPKYSDRLKTINKPDKKTSNSLPRLTSTQPDVCPRLNRTATVINTTKNATNTKQTTDSDWVCVNSKKKRKQQRISDDKQETIVETIDIQPPLITECQNTVTIEDNVENIVEKIVETENKHSTVEIETKIETIEKPVEIKEPTKVETKEVVNKSETKVQKAKKPQKKPKKRIIITDGALSLQVETTPPVVTSPVVVPSPPIVLEPEIERLEDLKETVEEKSEKSTNVSEGNVVESYEKPCPEPKKKKKRNKKPQPTPTINLTTDTDDDISSELERMISRGLYSSLEQRLQTHNPSDSFLSTLHRGAPSPPQPAVPAAEEKAPQPLRITQAVRDWMEQTRERTPEVEIFRKPEEIREEVLRGMEDLREERDREEELREELEQGEDPLERSRSASLSWDYDDCAAPSPPVETAVDVLEDAALGPYTSLYGSAGDFQRIQAEVRSRGPRDGGLPYRAICCSIM